MSQRQSIMTALVPLFATLKKSNGYNLDLGKNVKEWAAVPIEQGTLPRVSYRDAGATVTSAEFGRHEHSLRLEVEVFTTTPEDARKGIEDVVELLWANRLLGGLTRWISLDDHQIEQQQADRKIVAALMTFTVTYRTDLGAI